MVKKRLIITLIAVFSILVLTGFVLSTIHGNRVKAVAGITAGDENNENQNISDAELQGTESNQEINDNNQETGKRFGSGRDELYAQCYFTGTYVKDDSCALSKIPYYSFDDLIFNLEISAFFLGLDTSIKEYHSTADAWIARLMKICPAEEMRERSDETRYLVFDTDDNCRLFLMLSPDSPYPLIVGFPILYKNELSYKDFNGIQPGDTMTKVAAIDDICNIYYKEWFDCMDVSPAGFVNHRKKSEAFCTIHYLTDGLLKIVYGSLTEDGEPIVESVEFYPDYVMQTHTKKDLNYRINPLDLQK